MRLYTYFDSHPFWELSGREEEERITPSDRWNQRWLHSDVINKPRLQVQTFQVQTWRRLNVQPFELSHLWQFFIPGERNAILQLVFLHSSTRSRSVQRTNMLIKKPALDPSEIEYSRSKSALDWTHQKLDVTNCDINHWAGRAFRTVETFGPWASATSRQIWPSGPEVLPDWWLLDSLLLRTMDFAAGLTRHWWLPRHAGRVLHCHLYSASKKRLPSVGAWCLCWSHCRCACRTQGLSAAWTVLRTPRHTCQTRVGQLLSETEGAAGCADPWNTRRYYSSWPKHGLRPRSSGPPPSSTTTDWQLSILAHHQEPQLPWCHSDGEALNCHKWLNWNWHNWHRWRCSPWADSRESWFIPIQQIHSDQSERPNAWNRVKTNPADITWLQSPILPSLSWPSKQVWHLSLSEMIRSSNNKCQCSHNQIHWVNVSLDYIGKWQPIIPPQTVINLSEDETQSSRRRRRKPMQNSCRHNSAKFEIDEIEIDRIELTDNETCKLDLNRSSNRSELRKNNTFLRNIKKGSQALRHKQNKSHILNNKLYSKWYLVCLDVLKQIPIVNQYFYGWPQMQIVYTNCLDMAHTANLLQSHRQNLGISKRQCIYLIAQVDFFD